MSWQAVTWVLEQSQATLGARLVLLSIASHANREGRSSWPSVETVCIEARLTRREVQYCLRSLEEAGELHTIRGGGRGKSNSYELPFVLDWVTAQTLRSSEKQRNQSEKGRKMEQKTAHPIAHEPFPNHPNKEPSLENQENLSVPVLREPPEGITQEERESEVASIATGRAIKTLGRERKCLIPMGEH